MSWSILSKKKKKTREISVNAPDYIPKGKPIFKDTTGTEALDVFKVASSIARFFSLFMFAIGIFVIVMIGYSILFSIDMFLNPFFLGIIGLNGVLNITCGFLLLAKK
jgi:hypothetical protein